MALPCLTLVHFVLQYVLKRLIAHLPPVTSRQPREEERDGQNYCFVTREVMEKDIKESRYLEHGEYDGNLYGTKIDSIHEVVDAGRTCILDVNPQVC